VSYKVEKALNIRVYLVKAQENLISQETDLDYITTCISLVDAFRTYCNSMFRYTTILGTIMIENCELANHLVSLNFSKKDALTICNGLGAVLRLHLTYVSENEIEQLEIGESHKDKFVAVINSYHVIHGIPGQFRRGANPSLPGTPVQLRPGALV